MRSRRAMLCYSRCCIFSRRRFGKSLPAAGGYGELFNFLGSQEMSMAVFPRSESSAKKYALAKIHAGARWI